VACFPGHVVEQWTLIFCLTPKVVTGCPFKIKHHLCAVSKKMNISL